MKAHYENGLYKQLEDTQALLDKMTARLDRIEQEHKEEIAQLKRAHSQEIAQLKEEHRQEIARLKEEHRQEVAELKAEIEKRDKKIAELTARNVALEEEVARLKSIINNDSHNSSNPPSGDQKPSRKKANEYNSRRKSQRTQGGQKGHKGKTLTPEDVSRMLSSGNCEHKVKVIGKPGGKYVIRYTVDMRVVPVVTEYRIYQNKQGKYPIPAHLWREVAYGNRLRAFVVALYGIGVVSNDRIADFIQSMTQGVIRIATGTVYGFCRSFSEKATSSLLDIENRLMNRNVVHTDATVVSVNGVQSYIRNVSTDDAVMYYDMPHKTVAEMEKIDLLKRFAGVMVHDHETTLYRFPALHAECNVHILRYLEKNSQDTKNDWSRKMSSFFTQANADRKIHIKGGTTCFSDSVIAGYEQEYDRILTEGWRQNQSTKPKWAKQDEAALLRRLEKYKVNHLLFLHDFAVSFDNNMSERDLRKCKNRQKMSGGFRTQEGCSMYCDILSVIETAKRIHINPFDAISFILQGESWLRDRGGGEL